MFLQIKYYYAKISGDSKGITNYRKFLIPRADMARKQNVISKILNKILHSSAVLGGAVENAVHLWLRGLDEGRTLSSVVFHTQDPYNREFYLHRKPDDGSSTTVVSKMYIRNGSLDWCILKALTGSC